MTSIPLPLRALVASVAVLLLASCGGDGQAAEERSPFAPTESPTVTVTLADAPADYSEIEGEGFTISAPAEFQQQRRTSSNGEPMLVLESPSQVDAVPQRVVVVRDTAPVSPAEEQSFALETAKSAAGPEAEASRVQVPTPEGQSAYLVTWREQRAGDDGAQVEVTYWQLMWQVDDDLILNVVAFAPSAEFETSEVTTILRSFRPTGVEA